MMICHVNGYFPQDFFASSRASNEFESLSERITKAIICNLYDVNECNVVRGDDKNDEPDYLVNGKGFEVTFGTPEGYIPLLQGITEKCDNRMFSEDEIINGIKKAVLKKAKKNYVHTGATVVVLSVHPLLHWYLDEPQQTISDEKLTSKNMLDYMLPQVYEDALMARRNSCFTELYNDYINNGLFDDVLIMQSTFDSKYVIFSIKRFVQNHHDNYKKVVAFRDPDKFARYQVANCEEKENQLDIQYEYSFFVEKSGDK